VDSVEQNLVLSKSHEIAISTLDQGRTRTIHPDWTV